MAFAVCLFLILTISVVAGARQRPEVHYIPLRNHMFKVFRLAVNQHDSEIFVGRLFSKSFNLIISFSFFVLLNCYQQTIRDKIMIGILHLRAQMTTQAIAEFALQQNYSLLSPSTHFPQKFINNPFYERSGLGMVFNFTLSLFGASFCLKSSFDQRHICNELSSTGIPYF